jgi:hypothetical protein
MSRILTSNLSYPPWTYGPYSFPTITLQDHDEDVNGPSRDRKGSLLAATIPALRDSLNCTGLSEDHIRILFDHRGVNVNISADSTPGCPIPPISFWCSDYPGSGIRRPLEVGSFFDCYSTSMGSVDFRDPGKLQGPQAPGCPMMWFAYGRLSDTNKTEATTVLRCRPFIEQLDVEVVFGLPDYVIDATGPPRAVDNTAKVLFTEFISIYDEPVYPPPDDGEMAPFLTPVTGTATNGLDGWFKAMIHGVDGIPATDLLGNENIDNLIGGLERVFGIWMAQILNSYLHSTAPSNITIPTKLPSYNATITSPGRPRLVQGAVSTRIVQVLLGIIAFCAIITFLNQDTRRVLPKNPCSIAAVASLLAGSELLKKDTFPPGPEFRDDRYLGDRLFNGWVFSMGWWERKEGTPRFGIDVGQYDAKELDDLKQSSEAQVVHRYPKEGTGQDDSLHSGPLTTREAFRRESGRSRSSLPSEG